ncbi:probable UDP-3-O-acyl-N-acetylglucosamine deacetylase 2, mitochondrial isoform X1 [Tanacetum coccineum]|uniref:Probable UDP-3-O-acyl-N-acetylglucosamine deacetylase 2, mitochondrial isoform X1 n=1 Tax=Tanacetum coccineum TaxID=301880 RepID=A0ABQ5H4I5_9ASTR
MEVLAGKGRYFDFGASFIRASIEYAKEVSPLCTMLFRDGRSVRTVEHLLSDLEGAGVDNCRIEIVSSHHNDTSAEVPIFDGSAREWVEAIEQVGLTVAMDSIGKSYDKLAPYLTQPVHVSKGDSLIAAFPSKKLISVTELIFLRHELTDTSPFLNVNNQRYEDPEQEKTRNCFPLATLLEVNPQNYQDLICKDKRKQKRPRTDKKRKRQDKREI